jgi:hypothetical protein
MYFTGTILEEHKDRRDLRRLDPDIAHTAEVSDDQGEAQVCLMLVGYIM